MRQRRQQWRPIQQGGFAAQEMTQPLSRGGWSGNLHVISRRHVTITHFWNVRCFVAAVICHGEWPRGGGAAKKKSHRPIGTMRIFSLFYSILVCFLCIFVVIMNTKEKIHYITACLMLLFGCTLCVVGFAVKPVGIVDESVLLILGQCIIYAGSVFGISLYVKSEVKKTIGK